MFALFWPTLRHDSTRGNLNFLLLVNLSLWLTAVRRMLMGAAFVSGNLTNSSSVRPLASFFYVGCTPNEAADGVSTFARVRDSELSWVFLRQLGVANKDPCFFLVF